MAQVPKEIGRKAIKVQGEVIGSNYFGELQLGESESVPIKADWEIFH